MKKVRVLLVLLVFAGTAFKAAAQSRSIYFEGAAVRQEQQEYFLENFKLEAAASGYTVADSKRYAGYTFNFKVIQNIIQYDDGTTEMAPPDEPQFNILINFTRNEDDLELVSFDFPFSYLNDMYDYNQYLFLRAAVFIPPPEEGTVIDPVDDFWQNKWFYFRISAGFPVTFYKLIKSGDLVSGIGIYAGEYDDPDRVMPLDNKVVFLPAVKLGFELQFLKFMSLELNYAAAWERLNNKNIIDMAAGAELKFPVKALRNVTLAPYGAFSLPVHIPDPPEDSLFNLPGIFFDYPLFGFGGGLEIGIKAGRSGSLFFDINYLYYYGDAVFWNDYGRLYPKPPVIPFRRHVLELWAGYKIGAGNRK